MLLRVAAVLLSIPLAAASVRAAEHPSLADARARYNAGDYDGAIAAATMAWADPAFADAAALVAGRAHLQRFRRVADPADLAAGREALAVVRAAALSPRDRVDWFVGLGQSLYLSQLYGAAAELFETALARAELLDAPDRLRLLDWWATALDREAQQRPADRREPLYRRVTERMERELQENPGSAPANYWLAVAARGVGDAERAWDVAVAGWIRAAFAPDSADALRADLDALVTEVVILERARRLPASERTAFQDALRAEWQAVTQSWRD